MQQDDKKEISYSQGLGARESERGLRPIDAVPTSIPGFLGRSAQGPVNKALLITNWSQFTTTFGDFKDSRDLIHAVFGYFHNGGETCFVVNLGPSAKDEITAPDLEKGLAALEAVKEVALVTCPGAVEKECVELLLSHAESLKDRFVILDGPDEFIGNWEDLPRPRESRYGAIYFPWFEVYDPERGNIYVPPAGHVAGIYARSDRTKGVQKAPANEPIMEILDLKYALGDREHQTLNPLGINLIRKFARRGIRLWGARTLSHDPEWVYVNDRRLILMLEKSIAIGTRWCQKLPKNQGTWDDVRKSVISFLNRMSYHGALATAEKGIFKVKCDGELNTDEVVAADQLILEVSVLSPTRRDFLTFRICHTPETVAIVE